MAIPWDDLSKEEQCALLGAAERATLLDLLAMWRPGLDYDLTPPPVEDVRRMTEAMVSLIQKGYVEVYVDLVQQSSDDALSIVRDEHNWWTDDGPAKFVELTETPAGRAILASADSIYSFREHD